LEMLQPVLPALRRVLRRFARLYLVLGVLLRGRIQAIPLLRVVLHIIELHGQLCDARRAALLDSRRTWPMLRAMSSCYSAQTGSQVVPSRTPDRRRSATNPKARRMVGGLLAVVLFAVSGCDNQGVNGVDVAAGSDCPVTQPPLRGFQAPESQAAVYSDAFPPPDPHPVDYPLEGGIWYGTEDLWTVLSTDGMHGPRRSWWWSTHFGGGIVEDEPEIVVTWTRLDSDNPMVVDNGGLATNAYTDYWGWVMLAGHDPDEPGCWQVEATYKEATLTYVYEYAG
jgi:hypothetical protein